MRIPAEMSAPGALIMEELDARSWSVEELADGMGRSLEEVKALIYDETPITPAIAEDLAAALEISVGFWLNLEKGYRLWQSVKEKREPGTTEEAAI